MAIAKTHSNSLLGTFSENSFQLIQQARLKLAEKLQRRAIYRTTFAELDALSDRDLDDLGLARHNIRTVAYDTAYGDQ